MLDINYLKSGAIKIGKLISAERIVGTDKLILLKVSFGNETRQVLAAMAEFYEPEYFVGKKIPFVCDIAPAKIFGIKSEAMILAPNVDGKAIMLIPEEDVPEGTIVY